MRISDWSSDVCSSDLVDLRVVVDVVSGASAGGINGIILARALAHDLRIDHFRNLWLHEADVSRLLDPKKEAGQFSKFYMRPLLWLASRSRLGRVLVDSEVRDHRSEEHTSELQSLM